MITLKKHIELRPALSVTLYMMTTDPISKRCGDVRPSGVTVTVRASVPSRLSWKVGISQLTSAEDRPGSDS